MFVLVGLARLLYLEVALSYPLIQLENPNNGDKLK